jgi:hypothetical protein
MSPPGRAAAPDGGPGREAVDGDDASQDSAAKAPAGPTQATKLVKLVLDNWRIGRSHEGDAFATKDSGPAILLRGHGSLRQRMAAGYHHRTGSTPSASALTDALAVIEGIAASREPEAVHLRVGSTADGAVVLDLGDGDRAVVIGPRGWVVAPSPVLFRRTALTRPLPDPKPGGDLGALWPLTTIAAESRPLVLAWLIANLRDGAHPILGLLGQHGTGKTTTARRVAAVTDPSAAEVRAMPRDLEAWAVAASGSYVVPIDNVSSLPPWFSDALCRAVTGEGIVRRKLYTDSDVSVLSFRRAVILTSIDPGVIRGDLGDRLLAVETEPPRRRLTDEALADEFAALHGEILGGLCDLAVRVFAAMDALPPVALPRMADYGRVLHAVDAVLGTDGFGTYVDMGERVAEEVVESDHVALAVRALGQFTGTASDLLRTLEARRGQSRPPKEWPTTPRALRGALNRVAPALGVLGVHVEFSNEGRGKERRRVIRVSTDHG